MKNKIKYRKKYYGIFSRKDNFLYGAFEFSEKGLSAAKKYIQKSAYKEDLYIIKK